MDTPLPDEVAHAVGAYLRAADRVLPGGIVAAAVGGSIALDAHRPGASDVDLVALLDDDLRGRRDLLPRLRALHVSQLPRLLGRAVRGHGFSACCNTAFVWESDVSLPVSRIEPVASHTGELFDARGAFDVNPVTWHELTRGGIPVRGGDLSTWRLDPEPDTLRAWTRQNLHDYWAPLADRLSGRSGQSRRRPIGASRVEWCVLGPARMHATITSGDVVSKEEAGRRTLETFPEHAPIIHLALARLRRTAIPATPPRTHWREQTVDAMQAVITAATEPRPRFRRG